MKIFTWAFHSGEIARSGPRLRRFEVCCRVDLCVLGSAVFLKLAEPSSSAGCGTSRYRSSETESAAFTWVAIQFEPRSP